MKRRIMRILAVLMLALYLLCTACGGTGETVSPQDDPNEGLGGGFDEDAVNDFSEFEGTWLGEANNDYDHIDIDADGNWTLWYGEDAADYGYLRYEPEWGGVYAYSSVDDSGGRLVVQDDGRLYSTVFGYFNYGDGMEYIWYENGGNDGQTQDRDDETFYSWNSELCQRNVSEFEGIWYYDGDLSAEMYIVVDGDGDWSWYQRTAGEEAEEIDCGIFTYSEDEVSTYYADSTMYDGLSYRVFEFDNGVLIWGDEGEYYLME